MVLSRDRRQRCIDGGWTAPIDHVESRSGRERGAHGLRELLETKALLGASDA
ncbi:MAG TPA: hypothetical protein VIW03_13930 [Anaeromyxobacter sp.]